MNYNKGIIYCNNCGAEVKNGSSFCTNCGTKISPKDNKIQNLKTYYFNSPLMGGKTEVVIDNNILKIRRPGVISKLSRGFTGEKSIKINDIVSVQLKEAGFTRGYIQFITSGTLEHKVSITKDNHDENTIFFDGGKKCQANIDANEIKNYIENYNLKSQQVVVNPTIVETDKYDKLKKIKELLDEGIITQDEFEKEKNKILN